MFAMGFNCAVNWRVKHVPSARFAMEALCLLLLPALAAAAPFCGLHESERGASYPPEDALYADLGGCACTESNVCIRKCCANGYAYENGSCVATSFEFPAAKFKGPQGAAVVVPGMVKCPDGTESQQIYLEDWSQETLLVMPDGKLWALEANTNFDPDEYCVDLAENQTTTALLCTDPYVDDLNFADRLSFIGMMISLPFLFATFVVYALLPERSLHAKCLMCYAFVLFMAYFLHVFSFVYTGEMTYDVCKVIGMMALFCLMSSIFWMNVMSFDICSTFSGSRGFPGFRKQKERTRFIFYSIYAWGVPLAIVVLIVVLSRTVEHNVWYDPGLRGVECFLRDGYPELCYFYGPLAVLITANIVMFIVTTCKISKIQKDTAMLTRKGSKRHGEDDRQTFRLYIRLLFAMGLNWSVEIINWAVNWRVKHVPPAVWYVTDFFNAAYGVVIFFLFVFKKSIWRALKKRYYKIRRKEPPYQLRTTSSIISKSEDSKMQQS